MTNVDKAVEMLDLFDKSVEQFESDWTFMVEGEVILTKLRTKVVRSFLEHVLARCPQLAVSVRVNEVKEIM